MMKSIVLLAALQHLSAWKAWKRIAFENDSKPGNFDTHKVRIRRKQRKRKGVGW